MRFGKIDFPELLLKALRNDNLVIFAGAGVSMGEPANLPSFPKLAKLVAAGTGEIASQGEPVDRFLGRLHHQGVDVHTLAIKELTGDTLAPTSLHSDLLRLFHKIGQARIVTTNFDLLFEEAAVSINTDMPDVYHAPALPLGNRFTGIVHVHGSVVIPQDMVMTDSDFGRAYLTEGWARRFLVDVFRHFTVLFIGYSHDDVVMHYLARALPKSDLSSRFALVDDGSDPQKWEILGIHPVIFPKQNQDDFSELFEGVKRLADVFSRGILDSKRELTELAKIPPPTDAEPTGILELGLSEVSTARFFTKTARHIQWLSWMDERHYFDRLFHEGELEERDLLLASWLAKHYAINHSDQLWLLISKHGMRLNRSFWRILSIETPFEDIERSSPDAPTLAGWVSILLATAPAKPERPVLMMLGKKCIELGAIPELVQIFHRMAKHNLSLKPRLSLTANEEEAKSPLPIDVDAPIVSDHYDLKELWDKGLKPNLQQTAEILLPLIVQRLTELHWSLQLWQKADRDWDPLSWHRSAIEPHEQDKYPSAVDVLIDVVRECLIWIGDNNLKACLAWCELLIFSKPPLLRRIAVYAFSKAKNISNDEKITWLLDNIGLHDQAVHHEIYITIKLSYPSASEPIRKRVIESILAYRWSNEDDPDKEEHTQRAHFDWLHWIHVSDPECKLAKKSLDEIVKKNPLFKAREYPDLTHWTSVGWIGPQSPWTVNELLSKKPESWLPELLAFQGDDFRGPDRSGLVQTIVEVAKENFSWGSQLASELLKGDHFESDLWPGLIRAWADLSLDDSELKEILKWLGMEQIYTAHPRNVADMLFSLVKNTERLLSLNIISAANAVAVSLEETINRDESLGTEQDWLSRAINHPLGVLTEFWLSSMSQWLRHQEVKPQILPTEYETFFTSLALDESEIAGLGRTVMASQVAFLLSVDENWTKRHVLPLFDPENNGHSFQQAWDGFLTWGRLSLALAEALEVPFLKTVEKIETDLSHEQDRFVEFYSGMLAFYVSDPLEEWIPALFKADNLDVRRMFASQMGYMLRDLDEAQQKELWDRWLKTYWQNRLMGVPAPLDRVEIEEMLEWLVHLPAVFDEAVEIAIGMPLIPLQDSPVLFELRENTLVIEHPESIARLLIYIIDSGSAGAVKFGMRDIVQRLNKTEMEPSIQKQLEEKLATIELI